MSPHGIRFKPEPVRPVRYRLHRSLWQRVQPVVGWTCVAGAGAAGVLAIAGVIARMHATEAQLDAAYLRGMAAGQTMCRSN